MWLALAGAILVEVFATLSLRASDGFRKKAWIAPIVAGYLVSFYLLWVSLGLGMPVGIAYGVWSACGVALVAVTRALPVRRTADLDDGGRHRAHRRRRAHDRDGRGRALSAPASAITTSPAIGTASNPTRRLVASATTPTIKRCAEEADPHQPRQHRQPAARAHTGQLVGAVHRRRDQGGHPETRGGEPGDRAGRRRKSQRRTHTRRGDEPPARATERSPNRRRAGPRSADR